MKRNFWLQYIAIAMGTFFFCGCKNEFLDIKPSTSIIQPVSLNEFQKLLDNTSVINTSAALGFLAADEYIYSSDAIWESVRTATERNSYIWRKDLYEGEASDDWNFPYTAIFYANNVLEGIDKIKVTTLNSNQWNATKGWALFVRAFAYYELVNNFSVPYDAASAATDLGVPLRQKPSIDNLFQRSSVKETFELILSDLGTAARLLNETLPFENRNRPSKVAAHALFARIYLNMRDYSNAELHADTCLQLYSKLIDYNTLSKTAVNPFTITNDELIYAKNSTLKIALSAVNKYTQISDEIINLYSPNDLRLRIYFTKQTDGTYDMKRGYHGSGLYPFIGLASDEVYLIKAECLARRGERSASMNMLDQLLIKRWDPDASVPTKPYQSLVADTDQDALDKVLLERKKELIWRGLRWDDIKRLNKENANITLIRVVKGTTYTLPPNDPKYVFPIPDNEINLSGIQQNIR